MATTAAAAIRAPSCVRPKASRSLPPAGGSAGGWVSALIWVCPLASERRHRRVRPSDADRLSLYEPERVLHLELHRRGLARFEVQLERRVLREVRMIRSSVAVRIPPVA